MHYKPGPDKPRNLPGKALRDLLSEFGISGNDAADLAGYYLGYSRQAIQAMMSRTIRTNDYELLHQRLLMWKMEMMIAEKRSGPIREDGKRHRYDNWRSRVTRKRDENRELMRRERAKDPSYGRVRKEKPATRSTLNRANSPKE
jgi:hypothetical protein